jgi:hypothetical protein
MCGFVAHPGSQCEIIPEQKGTNVQYAICKKKYLGDKAQRVGSIWILFASFLAVFTSFVHQPFTRDGTFFGLLKLEKFVAGLSREHLSKTLRADHSDAVPASTLPWSMYAYSSGLITVSNAFIICCPAAGRSTFKTGLLML